MSLKIGPHSQNAPVGNEDCGIVRTIAPKKSWVVFNSLSGSAGSPFQTSQWYDTLGDGTTLVSIQIYATNGSGPVSILISQCDDTGAANAQSITSSNVPAAGGGFTAVTGTRVFEFYGVVTARYWRVSWQQGNTSGTFVVTATTSSAGVVVAGTLSNGTNAPAINAAIGGNSIAADASNTSAPFTASMVGQPMQVVNGFFTSSPASGSNYSGARTPAIFQGAQGGSSAGAFPVWTPSYAKKVRLMKYKIEIGEDADLGTAGPLNISFRFGIASGTSIATGVTATRFQVPNYQHRPYLSTSALTGNSEAYDSGLIDLGNGITSSIASQPLYCGLQLPAGTGGVTPTWTLPTTGQWEAGCCAFTTTGNKGAFKFMQGAAGANVATATTTTMSNTAGNTILVIVRSTNIAAGAPTTTVTDTAGNTYTALTQITNASDGAHGSSLQFFYCLSITGTQANLTVNAVTATGGTNQPTAMTVVAFEYSGIVAIDATGQTTGTGNSTAPVASSQAPTSAGTLILSYWASSTTQATLPIMSTAGFFTLLSFAATSAGLGLADNWGNGSLGAGLVNVIAMGTEE
jgi:hypothetical protein